MLQGVLQCVACAMLPRVVACLQVSSPQHKHTSLGLDDCNPQGRNILIIGDVHGCWEELEELLQRAHLENKETPFLATILVGDLVNKGPHSTQVVQWTRQQPYTYAIRGNHEEGVLKATLHGDQERLSRPKYAWARQLQQADLVWLANLPYTIRIPACLIQDDKDTVCVHAGLLPDQPDVEKQSAVDMVTLRQVVRVVAPKDPHANIYQAAAEGTHWASLWKGPYRVVYGHDARRGLQLHWPWSVGLDTGAVYGKQLTGIILPRGKIVQVQARQVYEVAGKRGDDKKVS